MCRANLRRYYKKVFITFAILFIIYSFIKLNIIKSSYRRPKHEFEKNFLVVIWKSSSRGNVCLGTIISTLWVIIPAHCIHGKLPKITVYLLSSFDENFYRKAIDIVVHPKYVQGVPDFDVALLRLNKEVGKSIILKLQNYKPMTELTKCKIFSIDNVVVKNSINSLTYRRLPEIDFENVHTLWPSNCEELFGKDINEKIICTKNLKTNFTRRNYYSENHPFPKDGGEPLVCRNSLAGFFIKNASASYGPTFKLFTSIQKYIEWIAILTKKYERFEVRLNAVEIDIHRTEYWNYELLNVQILGISRTKKIEPAYFLIFIGAFVSLNKNIQ